MLIFKKKNFGFILFFLFICIFSFLKHFYFVFVCFFSLLSNFIARSYYTILVASLFFHQHIIQIIHCFEGNIPECLSLGSRESPRCYILYINITSGGFPETEGQMFWYISREAMK